MAKEGASLDPHRLLLITMLRHLMFLMEVEGHDQVGVPNLGGTVDRFTLADVKAELARLRDEAAAPVNQSSAVRYARAVLNRAEGAVDPPDAPGEEPTP
jgi:hypothetical protein